MVLPRCQTPHGQENTFLVSTKEFSHSKETESKNQEAAQISSGPQPHYASGSPWSLGKTLMLEFRSRSIN